MRRTLNLNPQNAMLQEIDRKLAETMSTYWVKIREDGGSERQGFAEVASV